MTTVTVLVPDSQGERALSTVPGAAAVRYEPEAPLPEAARQAEVLVPPFLGHGQDELVAALPRLRLIQLLTAGYDAWAEHVPRGVWLSTARGAHGGSTAEWVLAVLLALQRELPRFVRAADARHWQPQRTGTLLGARVLIVGAGDVAQQVARRLEPFAATATLVGRSVRAGVRGMHELSELLPAHDIVVLAVPLTPATTGLVDGDFLARMPAGAILCNAARGPVVRTEALLAELNSGRLRAALDVTDPEPLPAEHPLWQAPGLLITPHVGGSVHGTVERSFAVAAEQIGQFVAGREPSNLVQLATSRY